MTINSMTGFASIEDETMIWEIRGVNHRFLELNFRLPDFCRHLEPALRTIAKSQLVRGKIDCSLRQTNRTEASLKVDPAAVQQVLMAIETIDGLTQSKTNLQGLELLKWPGVLTNTTTGPDETTIVDGFSAGLNDFKTSRQREGHATAASILERVSLIARLMDDVKTLMPKVIQAAEDKLVARIDDLALSLDSERLHQEVVLLASKADVAEEIDRVDAHLAEVSRCLAGKGPVGRRLDFLMQELNREANTLASKSIAIESTFAAVEMKVAIEQMREQIQNLE